MLLKALHGSSSLLAPVSLLVQPHCHQAQPQQICYTTAPSRCSPNNLTGVVWCHPSLGIILHLTISALGLYANHAIKLPHSHVEILQAKEEAPSLAAPEQRLPHMQSVLPQGSA